MLSGAAQIGIDESQLCCGREANREDSPIGTVNRCGTNRSDAGPKVPFDIERGEDVKGNSKAAAGPGNTIHAEEVETEEQ